ncbi:MAG TPA: formyltransferase family protein [Flavobacterium sp.]|uniref:methionyl-tRNA formyltransferase n=1 Tax=Flavobacterium sp. TaxID=239 RepID=UPI002B4AB2BD|nr:formyltransferase family protein [Flavobacterium sp.]HLO73756.1 formyltransferase family protein [Flavobacterium sp.]
MKFGFFLMTQKGFDVLNSLIKNQQTQFVDFICIGIDANLEDDFSDKIKELCEIHTITYFFKESLSERVLNSDFYIAISWRWLLDLSNLIIIHDSILPKYRGFAPLVNMLINGEKEIGATALFASNEYDKGDILAQEKIAIQYPITIAEAITVVGNLYIELVNQIIRQSLLNSFKPKQQNEKEATYSLWLDHEDYFIDWNWSAEKIKRKVDACGFPYDGAKTILENDIIMIEKVEVEQDVQIENRTVGKVIFVKENCPVIVCGKGLLRLTVAKNVNTKENILPLSKFRLKFK